MGNNSLSHRERWSHRRERKEKRERAHTRSRKMGCWRQTVVVASSAAVMVPLRPVMSLVSGPVPAVAGVRRALGFAATTRLAGEFNITSSLQQYMV